MVLGLGAKGTNLGPQTQHDVKPITPDITNRSGVIRFNIYFGLASRKQQTKVHVHGKPSFCTLVWFYQGTKVQYRRFIVNMYKGRLLVKVGGRTGRRGTNPSSCPPPPTFY